MIVESKHIQEGYVKTETHNQIATIEFYHPQSNALPSTILADLAHEITYAGHNKDVKVILLRSVGDKAFCAGASLTELVQIQNEKEGMHFFSGVAHVINAMRKCPKLIVVRVHGKCVGGGVGIIAAADYAIAVEGAEIRLSELAIGIGPFVIGPALERKMGLSSYSQVAIDATMWRNADWARRKGLYAELHATVEGMDESIARLTDTLSHSSPEAMYELKKILWHGTDNWDILLHEKATLSGKLIVTPFAKQLLQRIAKTAASN
jgi:methylglutaconyl-CoA hydratase